jgi:hypothetical protein
LRRKVKQETKKVVRELKKDNFVIQQEKQRIKAQKLQKNRKSTYRGGNAPRDEV